MLSLGLFVFEVKSAPFDRLQRSTTVRWASKTRIGKGAAHEFIGPGEDTITLSGTLAPQLTGGTDLLDTLRAMMAAGKTWQLVSGTGDVMGRWIIQKVDETREAIFAHGLPRKIPFTLTLERDYDENPAMFGNLKDSQS
jgi:phage protein U